MAMCPGSPLADLSTRPSRTRAPKLCRRTFAHQFRNLCACCGVGLLNDAFSYVLFSSRPVLSGASCMPRNLRYGPRRVSRFVSTRRIESLTAASARFFISRSRSILTLVSRSNRVAGTPGSRCQATLRCAGLVLLLNPLFASASAPAAPLVSTSLSATTPSRPMQTALSDPAAFAGPGASIAFARTHAAGATIAELSLLWNQVAPSGAKRPPTFQAADPGDPAYRWGSFDLQVRRAVTHGLDPLVVILNPPDWAQRPPPPRQTHTTVDPRELASFATAAAKRYSGSFQGLPRVRYWQIWTEPNLSVYLDPQLSTQFTKKPSCPFNPAEVVSTDLYRSMVNAAADAIHAARPGDLVVAGGLSPFCVTGGVVATAPLLFMRKLLCMSDDATPRPTCATPVHFDIWAAHPYTSGGPTRKARRADDVSIGDLPAMQKLLRAAVAARHVVSTRSVDFWVTEFGWDTKPPDCCAVPLALHARWVAEALYRMWLDGVTLVAWYSLRDEASGRRPDEQTVQSGLYFRGATIGQDRAKPSLNAFRFPFVAFRVKHGLLVWGRTPWGKVGTVVIEQSSKQGWNLLVRLRTNRDGIFSRTIPSVSTGVWVRARLVGNRVNSEPFSLHVPPDLFVNPFGGPA
jgi:hypothetical protein